MTQCKVSGTLENQNDIYRQLSDMLYIRKPRVNLIGFLLEDVKYSIHCTKPVKLEFFQILAQNKSLKISDDKNLCQNLNIGMNFPEIFGLARGLLSTWGR